MLYSYSAFLCQCEVNGRAVNFLSLLYSALPYCFTSTEVRLLIWDRDWGGVGGGDERVKAWPWLPPEKDWRDHGPPPEQWKAVSPGHCTASSALCNCCFNCCAGQSHKDNVHCTAVEEQLEAKEVQLSQPSTTSLLISSGLIWGSSSTSLLLISPGTL